MTAHSAFGQGSAPIARMIRYHNMPSHSLKTLALARYGAKLHRETGLPLLVTGGRPLDTALSEAETVRRVLEDEFGFTVRWLDKSAVAS